METLWLRTCRPLRVPFLACERVAGISNALWVDPGCRSSVELWNGNGRENDLPSLKRRDHVAVSPRLGIRCASRLPGVFKSNRISTKALSLPPGRSPTAVAAALPPPAMFRSTAPIAVPAIGATAALSSFSASPRKSVPLAPAASDGPVPGRRQPPTVTRRAFFCGVVVEGPDDAMHLSEGALVGIFIFQIG